MLPVHAREHTNFLHSVQIHPIFLPFQQLKSIASAILLSHDQNHIIWTFHFIIQKLHLLCLVYYIIGNKSTHSYLFLSFLPIKILIKNWILLTIKQYPVSLTLFFILKPTHTQHLFDSVLYYHVSTRISAF